MNLTTRAARALILLASAILLLGACSKTPQSRFLASCQKSSEACKCAADSLERKLSPANYSSMMDMIESMKDGKDANGNDVGDLALKGRLVNRDVSRAMFQSSLACLDRNSEDDAPPPPAPAPAQAPAEAPPAAPAAQAPAEPIPAAPAAAPAPATPGAAGPSADTNPTVVDLKVDPSKFANRQVTISCGTIWGADSSSVGCKSQGQSIWIDAATLEKNALRYALTNCGGFGNRCSGSVTGIARDSVGDLRIYDAQLRFR